MVLLLLYLVVGRGNKRHSSRQRVSQDTAIRTKHIININKMILIHTAALLPGNARTGFVLMTDATFVPDIYHGIMCNTNSLFFRKGRYHYQYYTTRSITAHVHFIKIKNNSCEITTTAAAIYSLAIFIAAVVMSLTASAVPGSLTRIG